MRRVSFSIPMSAVDIPLVVVGIVFDTYECRRGASPVYWVRFFVPGMEKASAKIVKVINGS